MKTIKELKTLDWSGYFFREMINILDIEPKYFMVNGFKGCKDGSILFNLGYCEENSVSHTVFNNIQGIFRKSGVFSYLIKSDKNKNMLDNFVSIIDQIKEEALSFENDEYF